MSTDEQGPDTAAMRTLAADWTVGTGDLRNAIEDLADALDEARTERDTALAERDRLTQAHFEQVHGRAAAEAAVVTARRDALEQAADEVERLSRIGNGWGDVDWSFSAWLRARAAEPPAEVCTCPAIHYPPPPDCPAHGSAVTPMTPCTCEYPRNCICGGWFHPYTAKGVALPAAGCGWVSGDLRCGHPEDDPIHVRARASTQTPAERCEYDFDGCPGDCPGAFHQRAAGGAATPDEVCERCNLWGTLDKDCSCREQCSAPVCALAGGPASTQGAAPTPAAEICPRCDGTGRIPPPCDDFAAVTDPYTNQPSKLCFNCHRSHPKADPHEFDRAHWLKHKPEPADTCCACGSRMDDPIHQRDEPQGTQSTPPKFGENGWLKAVQEGRVQAKGRNDG